MSAEFRVGRSVGRTIYQGDDLVGLMDTVELAERAVAAMNRPPQEPRTGGVAVWRIPSPFPDTADGFVSTRTVAAHMHGEPGTWFPLAEAEALIHPNDPAVRERIMDSLAAARFDKGAELSHGEIATAVLAALRSKP